MAESKSAPAETVVRTVVDIRALYCMAIVVVVVGRCRCSVAGSPLPIVENAAFAAVA